MKPQYPLLRVDRLKRPSERRGAGLGLTLFVIGGLMALVGFGRLTAVETVSGDLAIERQVNVAFAHGGVQRVLPRSSASIPPEFQPPPWIQAPPPPAMPATSGSGGQAKVRIDPGAKDPCPT